MIVWNPRKDHTIPPIAMTAFTQEIFDTLTHTITTGDAEKTENILRTVVLPQEVGYSLMCLAAQKNHVDIIRILIDRGCPVNDPVVKDFNTNMTPLQHACVKNNLELVTLLLDKGADINAVY
ncbi:hypothetical protein JTE90_013500 [Oedothorax gibbosus]|uniref:Alpha-latrotoxin n=1 Tax=Oedothorax gibbosus TaxID=931172 RepID=A0AAV6VMI8_9ARAC|nr:hypothetical protein JTE90_013500 [Oedothorax gibbosus]